MDLQKKIATAFIASILLISCSKKEVNVPDPLVTNRDTTINPADDFFMYANGGWFKRNPIPNTEKSNGIFRTINDTVNAQIKQICEKSAEVSNPILGSNEQKIGDFYASGMDTLTIEKKGLTPLKPYFDKINSINDNKSLLSTIGYLHTIGCAPAFSFYVGQDDKNSEKNALMLAQGGLGLGNRDYYFNTDKETENIRKEYIKHVQTIFELTGTDKANAQKDASLVMKLETELAKNSRKLEALRDPQKKLQ